MSRRVAKWARALDYDNPSDQLVMGVLARAADDGGLVTRLPMTTIQRRAKLRSVRTVERVIKRQAAAGRIEVSRARDERQRLKCYEYRLSVPAEAPLESAEPADKPTRQTYPTVSAMDLPDTVSGPVRVKKLAGGRAFKAPTYPISEVVVSAAPGSRGHEQGPPPVPFVPRGDELQGCVPDPTPWPSEGNGWPPANDAQANHSPGTTAMPAASAGGPARA